MDVPTMAIADGDNPKGFRLINESDFDPDEHKPYQGKSQIPEQEPTPNGLEPHAPVPTVQPSDRLEGLTLTQLRALAQAEDIKGRTAMDQEQLIQALEKKGYERGPVEQ